MIIATYQRPTCHLNLCLRALSAQNFPGEKFEVVVVDDGSDCPPEKLIAEFKETLHLRLVTQFRKGPAAARNTGALAAKGTHLAFTDDDCIPASNWLFALANTLALHPNDMIGGKTLNALRDNIYSTATQHHLDFLYKYCNKDFTEPSFFISHNLALRKDLFLKIGGFDQAFFLGGEDREICYRWLISGHKMTYAPAAIVYHFHNLSLRGFLTQHYNYGCGAFRFRQKVAKMTQKRIAFDNLGFYLRLIAYPFYKSEGHKAVLYSALLAISQIANASGAIKSMFTQPKHPYSLS